MQLGSAQEKASQWASCLSGTLPSSSSSSSCTSPPIPPPNHLLPLDVTSSDLLAGLSIFSPTGDVEYSYGILTLSDAFPDDFFECVDQLLHRRERSSHELVESSSKSPSPSSAQAAAVQVPPPLCDASDLQLPPSTVTPETQAHSTATLKFNASVRKAELAAASQEEVERPLAVSQEDLPEVQLVCCDRRFLPFSVATGSIYAVSRFRRMGLVILRMPFGVAVAVCVRPTLCEQLVAFMEGTFDRFR